MSTDSVTHDHTATASSHGATPASAPTPQVGEGTRAHAADMLRRLIVSAPLGILAAILSMVPAWQFTGWQWVVAAASIPVVTWGAWPFHRAAFAAGRHGSTTMDTLVSLGVISSTLWSWWALLWGGAGMLGMRMQMSLIPRAAHAGHAEIYFEGACMIVVFLLTGRYLEARARYRAGDALGVWFENDPAVVDEILAAVSLKGDEPVNAGGQGKTVREALLHDWEIGLNTPQFVQGYAEISGNPELKEAAADASAYAAANPIAGIVSQYPAALTAEQLAGLLRPLAPRLYSISSAPEEVGEEVHLTVGVLRYEHNGIPRTGAASGFLGGRLEEEGSVRVFVEENPRFRLPENPETPVIMIGAGTGVAPFRAFMQQRAANGDSGKNWLIFGNQHFTQDFLYQTEWQGWAKDGLLNKYDFAWSRDQEEKIYVQHKIREEAAELWQWLQQGAHIYVCGDASRMAKDVEQALLDTIAEQGGLSPGDADEYLDNLRQEGRYQRDVY